MGHYAQIINNKVANVIVAKEDFVLNNLKGEWLKTSYNTRGGEHTEGGTPIRKNFAGIGYDYDRGNDAFVEPTPHNDWVLNTTTFKYEPPVVYPTDGGAYSWDEETSNWLPQLSNP
jgi:hypothetical protein